MIQNEKLIHGEADKEQKDAYDYILPYIITIGSSKGEILDIPEGSGVLVRFVLNINEKPHLIYGILSASHVIEKINFIRNLRFNADCIGLVKPVDRLGNTRSETYPIKFVYVDIDKSHYRRLSQNHEVKDNYENERDIGFVCLGVDKLLVQSDLMNDSDFFDLDSNQTLNLPKEHDQPFIFFKGACIDELVNKEKRTLTTELVIEKGGIQKQYPKSSILYHEIPNTKRYSMKGASGAGVWMFSKNSNNEIITILKAIIVEGGEGATDAIDISHVKQQFLPKLQDFINKINLNIKLVE